MSSSTLKPAHPKKLRELLQEKQEPFTLDIYLSERYPKKINLNSNSFKRTCNLDSKKIRKGLPNSSKVLKLVTRKLSSYRSCSKLSTCKCEDQRREKFSNMFQALKPPRPRELKADTTKCQCGSTVDIKQLIPISAEASSVHKNKKYVLITREEESKRVSRQTKQLLYEGTNRETVGPKENRKIMFEKVCSWGKQSAYLKDTAQMINLDFSNDMEQWNNFQLLNSDIRIEIGDAILDDIVSEVI